MRLQEVGQCVTLRANALLEPVDDTSRPVYFLLDAVASIWVPHRDNPQGMSVALVGSEGLVGCAHLWPDHTGPWVARVFKSGQALQIEAQPLLQLMTSVPGLAESMSRFLWQQTQEIAQLSTRMQQADIRAQLALWLHLLCVKTGQQTLQLTQQTMADMMGTRRVSVTLAAGQLQQEGLLTLRRGAMQINDLQGLAQVAGLQT